MPVLSPSFRAAQGIDGQLSVDTALLTEGVNGRQWLNDDEVLTSRDYSLVAVHRVTKAERLIDNGGANTFVAGANMWAAWLDKAVGGKPAGYRDGHGTTHPDWFPLAIDNLTGIVAILLNGRAGTDLAFWRGSGQPTLLREGPLYPSIRSFKDGIFAAQFNDWRIRTWSVVTGEFRELPPIPALRDALLTGEYGVGWCDTFSGIVAYKQGQTVGVAVTHGNEDFNADAILDGTTLIVATSRGSGERKDELQRYAVDVTHSSSWNLNLLAPPAAVVPPVAQSPNRAIAVGCFDEPNAPDLTGHGWPSTPLTKGVFVDLVHDSAEIVTEQTLRAVREGLPIYIYKDSASFSPAEMPTYRGARQIAMPRNTIEAGESREAAMVRIRGTVQKFRYAGYDVALDFQMTCGVRGDGTYTWTEQEILDRAADAWQIAVEEGVLAVWCFAWDRADGIAHFASFQQFVSKIRSATPNWQAFPASTPKPPKPEGPKPPTEEPDMKSRKIYLRSKADAKKYVGLTAQHEGALLVVSETPTTFYALLVNGKWADMERTFLAMDENGAVLVQAKGDGAQLNLNDRYGSPLGITNGVGGGWGLIATGSPVSLRIGRPDYHGDDVGQVRTMDPTYPIGDWETIDVIDANTGKVIGPF